MAGRFWRIPQIWDGDTCVIVGGGPSLAGFDVEKLRPFRVIAVNCAYRLANWFEFMFFGDGQFLSQHGSELSGFCGLKVTIQDKHLNTADIRVVRRQNQPHGISHDPTILRWNLSSGACAINLASLLGAGKIILLGFDMRMVKGRNNYHDYYSSEEPQPSAPFEKFLRPFPAIATDLKTMGIECVNATPFFRDKPLSELAVFPRIPIEEALTC